MANQIKMPSSNWCLDFPEIKRVGEKRKRMEENTEAGNMAGEEEDFYLSKDQLSEWGNNLLTRLAIRNTAIRRIMDAKLNFLTKQVENVYQMKIQKEEFEKENDEMEATIERLQNFLKSQSEIKCGARENKQDEGNRGLELEPSPTPTAVFGDATTASAATHGVEEIEKA